MFLNYFLPKSAALTGTTDNRMTPSLGYIVGESELPSLVPQFPVGSFLQRATGRCHSEIFVAAIFTPL